MRIPPPARTGPRSRRRDAGSASVEMVLITPLIILLLLLAVAMSRMVSARIDTDAGAFRAGGIAKVTVTCTTTLSDLGLPLPGHHDSTSRAAAPVDTFTYREATP